MGESRVWELSVVDLVTAEFIDEFRGHRGRAKLVIQGLDHPDWNSSSSKAWRDKV